MDTIKLNATASINDIIAVVDQDRTIGKEFNILVGERCVIAERKYTWQGRVAKTAYLHIYHVESFERKRVITHWREQKDKSFKTM
jgi:hypothetical protein